MRRVTRKPIVKKSAPKQKLDKLIRSVGALCERVKAVERRVLAVEAPMQDRLDEMKEAMAKFSHLMSRYSEQNQLIEQCVIKKANELAQRRY